MSPVNVTSPCSVSMRTLFRSSCLALGVLKRALPPSFPFPELEGGAKNDPPPAFPPNVAQKERENFIAMIQKSVLFGSRSVLIAGNQSQIKKGKKICGVGFRNFFATLFAPRPKEIHNIAKKEEAEPLTVSKCNCLLTFMLNKL